MTATHLGRHVAILVNDRGRAERPGGLLRRIGLRRRCGRRGRSYPSSRLPFAPLTATAVQAACGGGEARPRRGAGVGGGRETAEGQSNGRCVGYEGSRAAGERSCCYGSAGKKWRTPGSLSAKQNVAKRPRTCSLGPGRFAQEALSWARLGHVPISYSTSRTACERQRMQALLQHLAVCGSGWPPRLLPPHRTPSR